MAYILSLLAITGRAKNFHYKELSDQICDAIKENEQDIQVVRMISFIVYSLFVYAYYVFSAIYPGVPLQWSTKLLWYSQKTL